MHHQPQQAWTLEQLKLLEYAPDAMIAADEHGLMVFVNSQTEKLFGYAASELVGRPVELLVPRSLHHQHRADRAAYHHASHSRPMGVESEIRGVRKDGVEIPLDISLSPIRVDTGHLVLAAVRDMTERKDADRRLRDAHRRLQRDMDGAAALQRSLLPKTLPQVDGMRFAWAFQPSERLAGDSFNVFVVDDDHVAFYLLDVSGHGVAAALQAVALTRVLASRPWPSSVLRQILSPTEVTAALNREFPIDRDTWQYFTFICGTLDIPTAVLRFTAAGHPGPIHLPANGEPTTVDAPGFPIGLFPDAGYEEHRLPLNPGDRILFHSDGATDAVNLADVDFGRQGLVRAWSAVRHEPLDVALETVVQTIKDWSGGRNLADDLTLLAIEASRK